MTKLHLGDCLEVMAGMDADSIDSIVCDPPYGLEFMGKEWDHGVPGVLFWEAALRVAKPGAMLLAFGGTRTSHRLACAIEDAGWEIRDTVVWLYASGFPKSHNISKAIDRAAGAEREVVGERTCASGGKTFHGQDYKLHEQLPITAPATDAAKLWEGWGTALAPSHEPIILAMKPRDGTFANNALKHGVAGLNIDGARIPTGGETPRGSGSRKGEGNTYQLKDWVAPGGGNSGNITPPQGRWPKNTIFSHHPDCVERGVRRVKGDGHWTHKREIGDGEIYGGGGYQEQDEGNKLADPDGLETVADWDCHPDCAVRLLAGQSGEKPGSHNQMHRAGTGTSKSAYGELEFKRPFIQQGHNDTGTAARFFYCAKSSRKERNLGLDGTEASKVNDGRQTPIDNAYQRGETLRQNTHPTVKPLEIMRYLCKLTKTPTGGVVLDPFMGSGTTGMAAILESRDFIGIEISEEYYNIARKRIAWAQAQPRKLL